MDGTGTFTAPTIGGNPNNIGADLNNLAPMAQAWTGPSVGVPTTQVVRAASTAAPAWTLADLGGFAGGVAKEIGSVAVGATRWAGDQLITGMEAPIKYGASLANWNLDRVSVDSLNAQTQELNTRLDNIQQSYKAGTLTKQQYLQALDQWNQDNRNVSSQISSYISKSSIDQQNATKQGINTIADVMAFMTGSLGAGLKSADEVAASKVAASDLMRIKGLVETSQAIDKLANTDALWKAASPLAQRMMTVATSEALRVGGTEATASQLARATAANILLKYPLYYNAISSTGQQVYDKLNNNKYGDAVKTLAINAALLFSGGPIGWGLKRAGGLLSDASVALGLRPGSILDELSSRFGNGDRLALAKIAQEQLGKGNTEDVKAMITALDSNLKASNGNAAAAINLITDHLSNYIGWGNLKGMSHQEAWDNLVNYWKHAANLENLKKLGLIKGIDPNDARMIVPGRFSSLDKGAIASYVSQTGKNIEGRLKAWQDFKDANPNASWSNNPNVDKQITNLIKSNGDAKELAKAINSIPTEVGLEGVPKAYAAQMAKDGYIAIIPNSHNLPVVPFSETSGKLATAAVTNDIKDGFFVRAAAPVPVLQSIGNVLVKAGLSPEMASQSVQSVFQDKFTAAADKFGFTSRSGDQVLAKLSNYMKNPTGILGKVPITDYRQLTVTDITKALGVQPSDAKTVQRALMQAYLDVPREITGLGPKIVDYAMAGIPLQSLYSRVQGATRFTWNPFFEHVRLPFKLEFLSQMETGGKFPTIPGTNRVMSFFFPGQYKELNSIVDNPDFKAMFEHGGLGGESDAAATGVKAVAQAGMPPREALLPVAGVIKSMADKAGLSTADFLKQFPTEAENAATALMHYDRNASFLNSPLAKTLNFAFFPFRFNVKVSTFMARFLMKQPPGIQYATIVGLMNTSKFLKSDQGQAWYSQHANVIGLLKYISPLETLSTISSVLGSKPDSVAQFGELGGLPFGWIPLALDSAGITHFGQAYVNPKTGVIAKNYIPTSAYGSLNAAIQDFLGSVFSYPGAEVGLPSKGTIVRGATNALLPGSGNDFQATMPTNVTPQEQHFSQIVQQLNNGGTIQAPQITPQNATMSPVPTQKSPLQTALPKTTAPPKLKKSQFKPQPLP